MGVRIIIITTEQGGQRIDNFMLRLHGGVPRSRIYKAIRKGEVRVNKKRVRAEYHIQPGDSVRIPPLLVAEPSERDAYIAKQMGQRLLAAIAFEDHDWLVINKPSGIAVHAGSSQVAGVIEGLRAVRDDLAYLELGHRLDKDTSGCLLLAKNRRALLGFQVALRQMRVKKTYHGIISGQWPPCVTVCSAPLLTCQSDNSKQKTCVDPLGKEAVTHFYVEKSGAYGTLLRIEPQTGRTHQIRVHCAHSGFPLIGDVRYGWQRPSSWPMDSKPRLMLHASALQFTLEETGRIIRFVSPMPKEFEQCLQHLVDTK